MKSSNLILNRLFSKKLLFDLPQNSNSTLYNTIIKRFAYSSNDYSNCELIKKVYKYMTLYYRNEYIYQNILFNKLLLGKHSLNTTTALSQVPIGKSKADFVLINGKAVVYEIKTELDTFERLELQLNDYYKAFTRVCLVIPKMHYKMASKLLLKWPSLGIYVLSDRNTFSEQYKKEPDENNTMLEYSTIFKLLRKSEFESIIKEYYGSLPKATQAFYYGKCYDIIKNIPLLNFYEMMIKELKKRNKLSFDDFESKVPNELKSLVYFARPNKKQWQATETFLNSIYSGG